MSKKLLAVIALVVASLFVFTACGGEDYKFDALDNNPAASATARYSQILITPGLSIFSSTASIIFIFLISVL